MLENMVQILLYDDEEFAKILLKSSGLLDEIHTKYEKLKKLICESSEYRYGLTIFEMFKLKEVSLAHLKLDTIPEELFDLKNIEYLNLSGNNLETISENISKLSNIKILDLSFNEFKKIPKEICVLDKLENLRLGFNKIWEIPTEFYNLVNLVDLFLFDNQITEFDLKLAKNFKKLKTLKIKDNPVYRKNASGLKKINNFIDVVK